MPLVYACLCPNAPLPPEAARTAEALARLADELRSAEAEIVVLLLARARGPNAVLTTRRVEADGVAFETDEELAGRIESGAASGGFRDVALRHLDAELSTRMAALLAPLREAIAGARVVVIATSRQSRRLSFDFGQVVGRAIDSGDRRVAIVCGVGLAGAGEGGEGSADERARRMFAGHYLRALERWDVKWMVHGDDELRRRVGEDAVTQTATLMGVLSAHRIEAHVLSYEAPGDAGYVAAAIDVRGPRRAKQGA